jgi:hypothetical protein
VFGFQVVVGSAQVGEVGVDGGAAFGVADGVVDVGAVAGYPAAGEAASAVADGQEAAQAGAGEPVGRITVGRPGGGGGDPVGDVGDDVFPSGRWVGVEGGQLIGGEL